MSDLYMNEWKAFLSELEAAPKKAVASLDKFRKDMLGGGAKSSAPFTQDGFPKDFNKPEEFSAPAMEEADVEEDKLFKPLSKSQKAHSSKLIRVKYKDRPLDADGVIDPKVAKGEKESLDEIKMDQVMPRFDSKAFKNAMEQKYDVPPGRLELLKRREPKGIRDMVPGDIEEKYKPEALNWLITTYINDPEFKSSLYHNFFINKNSIRKNIETFFQIKQVKPSLLSKNDIYSIKTIQEFEEVVEAAKPAWQEYNEEKESKDASLGTSKIYENDNWEVFIPENKGAACKLGKGTEWCTAAPGLEYYSHYHKKDDPLIVFISKQDPSEKYQFHYGTEQFMDKDDHDMRRQNRSLFYYLNNIVVNSPDELPEKVIKIAERIEDTTIQETIKEEIMNLLYEKKDRCYNIAKRKYKAFPSAYASGAIVKCRQGKIWKKEK